MLTFWRQTNISQDASGSSFNKRIVPCLGGILCDDPKSYNGVNMTVVQAQDQRPESLIRKI